MAERFKSATRPPSGRSCSMTCRDVSKLLLSLAPPLYKNAMGRRWRKANLPLEYWAGSHRRPNPPHALSRSGTCWAGQRMIRPYGLRSNRFLVVAGLRAFFDRSYAEDSGITTSS